MPTDDVLDLIRRYGDDRTSEGGLAATGDHDAASEMGQRADALHARIAELLPQQPVQARGEDGLPLWIHMCGDVTESTDAPTVSGCCAHGLTETGPWRPLLVAADSPPPAAAPAPRTAAEIWTAMDPGDHSGIRAGGFGELADALDREAEL